MQTLKSRPVVAAIVVGAALAAAATAGAVSAAKFPDGSAPAKYTGAATGPAPAAGKTVAVIICGAAAEGCVRLGNGAKEAAAAIGWKVKLYDGQNQPASFRSTMLQAIGEKVDGIVLAAIPSSLVGDAVEQARKAGIKVVSAVAENPVGNTGFKVDSEVSAQSELSGKYLAGWVADNAGSGAKIAMFHTKEFTATVLRYKGSIGVFKKCGAACTVVADKVYAAASAATNIPLQVKSLLQANPSINMLWFDIGSYGAFAAQAVNEIGLKDKVKLVSFDCNPDDVENIRKGNVQVACAGLQLEAAGWGTIDALNRLFGGQKANDTVPIRTLTKDSLPPKGQNWSGDFDFRANYKKIWGVK